MLGLRRLSVSRLPFAGSEADRVPPEIIKVFPSKRGNSRATARRLDAYASNGGMGRFRQRWRHRCKFVCNVPELIGLAAETPGKTNNRAVNAATLDNAQSALMTVSPKSTLLWCPDAHGITTRPQNRRQVRRITKQARAKHKDTRSVIKVKGSAGHQSIHLPVIPATAARVQRGFSTAGQGFGNRPFWLSAYSANVPAVLSFAPAYPGTTNEN